MSNPRCDAQCRSFIRAIVSSRGSPSENPSVTARPEIRFTSYCCQASEPGGRRLERTMGEFLSTTLARSAKTTWGAERENDVGRGARKRRGARSAKTTWGAERENDVGRGARKPGLIH